MAAVPFVLRHHRALALAILTLGTALAGGLLGAMVLGLMGGAGERFTFLYDGYGARPEPFNPQLALVGAITTGLLSGLVPHLAWRARREGDDVGTIVRTAAKLGVANTALVLLSLFGMIGLQEVASGRFGALLDGLVITVIATVLCTLVGALIAGPLGIVFGLVFALPIEHTWVAFLNDDVRAPEVAARWVAAMLVFVGAVLQLTPAPTLPLVGGAVVVVTAIACALLSVVLRAVRRRFLARLSEHPQLTCVPIELAEVPVGVVRLAVACAQAVVERSPHGPYRDRPRAVALAP